MAKAKIRILLISASTYHRIEFFVDKLAAILSDDIFKCIFVNEKFCILIKISLKFVPKGPFDNNPPLV